MVDSPVSGSVLTVQNGRASFMVGGASEDFARLLPILLDLGAKVCLLII
jgi:3-hydroxyisobutyrate dehydrogenase-like beta-hydroxyacid dehydrogenase